MIELLFALQLSTTNCQSNYAGGFNCTTMTPPPLQPIQTAPVQTVDTDWGAIFSTIRENKRAKAVGQMLAKGDCAGAETYALQRGDFALVGTVRQYCTQVAATAPVAATTALRSLDSSQAIVGGAHKVRAKTPSGYCLDVSADYVGTGAGNSPAVTSAMPRCDQLSVR